MKNLRFNSLTLFVLSIFLGVNAFAGTVSLDPTFNGTGYRIQSISSEGAIGESVAVQSDGKIVLGGWTLSIAVYGSFAAMRVNANGTLDSTFNNDGLVTSAVNNFNRGDTLLMQPDGKILLGGDAYSGDSNDNFTILRYNTNGFLDTTFDGNGVATHNVSGFSDEHSYDMALQPDGKIVMVGTTAADDNLPTDIVIMRLNTNGSLDPTFNGTGILPVRFQNVSESANAVIIQPDGKIVIGGYLNNSIKDEFLLMRFNANGSPDTTFGSGGLTITSVSGGNDRIRAMAVQSDGKILAGGGTSVARYTANGNLDTTFGSSGSRSTPHIFNKIIVRSDDKFLVGGAPGGFTVSRYQANGTIDTSFNATGTAAANIPGNSCTGNSLAVQGDNKIVMGGHCTANNNTTFAVVRLQEEISAKGVFDFDGDRKTDISIFRPSVGEWWINQSSSTQTVAAQFGASTDKPTPADFTGDGKTDIAFWRASTGEWFILRSEDSSFLSFPFGASGDVPLVGDFDGDGKADPSVYRPSTNEWFILKSSGGTTITTFGAAGDLPVAADYDGDAKTDVAIYRPSAGEWWIRRSSNNSVYAFQFGTSSDKPVPGDYTGDGKADSAFWRPSTGEWFILRSEDSSFYAVPFGASGDAPVAGDYDGDGRFDTAVFRPTDSTWYVNRSTAGLLITTFGIGGDKPLPNVFVP
jgi:uncharacterized delta-60 repeat protein